MTELERVGVGSIFCACVLALFLAGSFLGDNYLVNKVKEPKNFILEGAVYKCQKVLDTNAQ